MMLKKRYIWAVVLCCYFAAVLYLCLSNPENIPSFKKYLWEIPADKIAHFLMFSPYPVIAYLAFRPDKGGKLKHLLVLLTVSAAGAGLAIGTEHLQGLSGHRSCEIGDFYADMTGIGCSAVLTSLTIIFKKNRRMNDL